MVKQSQNTGVRPRPVILGTEHVNRALSDANFFTAMPEFSGIRRKMAALNAAPSGGCASCQRRRVATSFTSDFVSTLSALPDEALQRIKKYFGFGRMLVRSVNKSTKRIEMKEV